MLIPPPPRVRGTCLSCRRLRCIAARGLCKTCHRRPDIRNAFKPLRPVGADRKRPVVPPGGWPGPAIPLASVLGPPTSAEPGSPEKVLVLELRALLGQYLWHPLDAPRSL